LSFSLALSTEPAFVAHCSGLAGPRIILRYHLNLVSLLAVTRALVGLSSSCPSSPSNLPFPRRTPSKSSSAAAPHAAIPDGAAAPAAVVKPSRSIALTCFSFPPPGRGGYARRGSRSISGQRRTNELMQPHMAQNPVLRGEVGCRSALATGIIACYVGCNQRGRPEGGPFQRPFERRHKNRFDNAGPASSATRVCGRSNESSGG